MAAGSGQRLDQLKRADVEGAFLSRQPIHDILDIVSVHRVVGGQTCFANGSSVASNVVSMRGSAGDMKKVSAIIRLAASSFLGPRRDARPLPQRGRHGWRSRAHDLQRPARTRLFADRGYKAHELFGLLGETETQEGIDRERRAPQWQSRRQPKRTHCWIRCENSRQQRLTAVMLYERLPFLVPALRNDVQIVLPRRQLMDNSAIMDFLLSYVGKFDLCVEDQCPAYVRYCFTRSFP